MTTEPMTNEQWQEIKMNYESGFVLSADTLDLLIAEIERLRAEVERLQEDIGDLAYVSGERNDQIFRLESEVERLTSPKPGPSTSSGPGFLTWLNELGDSLPVGTVIGVSVEELGRWFEAGVSVEVALRRCSGGPGERVRGEGL